MRARLFDTADYYLANGSYDPLFLRGYGVLDAYAAANVAPGLVDLNDDGDVNLADLSVLTLWWLGTGCELANDFCGIADITGDGTVDLADLATLTAGWLLP